MTYNLAFVLLICSIIHICVTQRPEKLTAPNPCSSKLTCHECIQTPSCAWCSQPNFSEARCFQPSSPRTISCPANETVNPDNIMFVSLKKELTKARGSAGGAAAGAAAGAAGAASGAASGAAGAAAGGSYYESSYSSKSSSSWESQEIVQVSPQRISLKLRAKHSYSIWMYYTQAEDYPVDLYYLMDLSKSMEDDKDKLSSLGNLLAESMRNITSNFRLGFGSFVDKVVMPYVSTVPKKLKQPCTDCEAPYGFRNHMTLSTNTSQFSLGGIVKPNDGMCHLDSCGMYTHSTIQDYPSISQISLKVKQNAINVIFAVTEEQISVYKKLQEHIEGSSSGKLSADSSNVVDLVKEQYKVGDVVAFRLNFELTECPKDPAEWQQTIQIYPVGLNESLIVDLEMLCSCPCERPGNPGYEEFAPQCSTFGTYKCGVCECDPFHFGRFCECSSTGQENYNNTIGCRPDNATTIDCSGRGSCVCGRCECDIRANEKEVIYGDFCECDNFSCEQHDGQLCSGHGTCHCGICECEDSWIGDACECHNSTTNCYAPDVQDGEICSGHGDCVCGVCECRTMEEGRYSGRFCEKCPTCSDRCEEFKSCVQCQMYQTGPLKDDCATNCTKFTPIGVEVLEVKEENEENLCAFYDEEDCRFAYVYYFDDHNKVQIRAQQHRECPPTIFLLGIVLGVIAAIVLMGLAILLLWKLVTTIHDRREFARFEKERMMAKWDTGENPIYKQATSTFKNPTYAGKG